jgi:hypothetical protein
VVVKPAGIVHRNVFGPGPVRMLSINLLSAGPDTDARLAALQGWRWMEGGPASRALWRLLSTARAEPGSAPALLALLADGFWEMVDALEAYGAPSASRSNSARVAAAHPRPPARRTPAGRVLARDCPVVTLAIIPISHPPGLAASGPCP